MSISSINGINLNAWYGQDVSSTDSNPLFEVNGKKKTDLYSMLNPVNSSLLGDSVDLSQMATFFSKLQQLEKTDPDKFKEVAKALGDRLKNSQGNGESVLAELAGQVAMGKDISEVILKGTTASDSSSDTLVSQIKELLARLMNTEASDE
jgi:hypothetical protein